MTGFFKGTGVTVPKRLGLSAPACGACGLFKSCKSPKQGVYGKGNRRILLIDSSPSSISSGEEPFGRSREDIELLLKERGVDLENDCWYMSSIACSSKNAPPTAEQVRHCSPLFDEGVKSIDPLIVITFGYSAAIAAIGNVFPASSYKVDAWYGWQIPDQLRNFWICPTYALDVLAEIKAPQKTYLDSNGRTVTKKVNPFLLMIQKFLEQHLDEALKFKERPWKYKPEWLEEVKVLYSDTEAAEALEVFLKTAEARGEAIAFDIETNTLKPDPEHARIVCVSVCRGITAPLETLAVPWGPKVKAAFWNILRSECPKIGANFKFENRWMIKEYGEGAKNWQWDVVTNAHILDNRDNVSGVKFQAYALLGQEDYSSNMRQFFESDGSMTPNRINEVKTSTLLKYCGMDSLLEFRLAIRQARLMHYPLPWIV